MIKVNIVELESSDKEADRRQLLTKLIAESDTSSLVLKEGDAEYIIYLDSELLKMHNDKGSSIEDLLKFKDHGDTKVILDVTEDYFNNLDLGSLMTLCTVCAHFVTCSSSELQELIYEHTGRLAFVIENPVLPSALRQPDEDSLKNIENPFILWFGDMTEAFSIRKEQVKYENKYEIHTLYVKNETMVRKFDKVFYKTNLVYLPKTYDDFSERQRVLKVILALIEGKFVVAPDLDEESNHLALNANLADGVEYYKNNNITDWIEDKQQELLKAQGWDKSLTQVKKALELVPKDDYFDNLDYLLETEEISI